MVSALASSAVDRWLERRLGQIKSNDYEIGICCSPISTQHYREKQIVWLGIRIMYQSGATWLSADCCVSELALKKSNSACLSSTKQTLSSSH
jgi:hypothetical protein